MAKSYFSSVFSVISAATLLISLSCSQSAQAAHAFALHDAPKYPVGFDHLDYATPNAKEGGELILPNPGAATSFDKFNPYTLKGIEAAGLGLVFETLLVSSADEPATAYGLLADDVSVAEDRLSVTFHLNSKARFSNGDAVLAEDVKYSFDSLMGPGGHPKYKTYWADVDKIVVLNPQTVRFDFKRVNREMPLVIGQMPVFSHKWGKASGLSANGDGNDKDRSNPKDFDKIVTDMPIASGKYQIDSFDMGRRITYKVRPDYWGKDLGIMRGLYHFERVTFRYYKDNFARLEAFKAGEFDVVAENVAKSWARSYKGPRFDSGELIKTYFQHSNAAGFQGFMFNQRKPIFADIRVRQALGLAMDFEWMNRQLFYGQYKRLNGYFANSEMQAHGEPDAAERALLEPLARQFPKDIPANIFGPLPMPPRTDDGHSLRDNLRTARTLLQEAGWTFKDGALRNAKGEAFTFEVLDSQGAMTRLMPPFIQALEKLGIQANYRLVDPALYQERTDKYDFDVTSRLVVSSPSPGNELWGYYGSESAREEGQDNLFGIQNKVVDALIDKVVTATTRADLVTACRALDRVLTEGYYAIPHWYNDAHRVAYRNRFMIPTQLPKYYQAPDWVMQTWALK